MASLWSRLTGRIHKDEEKQVEDLAQMSPHDRAIAEESPSDHVIDERADETLGGQPGATPDPDDPSDLLSGPTS